MNRKKTVRDFYAHTQKAAKNSGSEAESVSRAVGWFSEYSARITYGAAANSDGQDWKTFNSVLDIGSGTGTFLSFLREEKGFSGHYTGLEILDDFDALARKRFADDPKSDFICGDFLEYDFGTTVFDWCFSLGSLSVVQPNQANEDRMTVKKMNALSRFGFSIFLNDAEKTGRKNAPDPKKPEDLLTAHNIDDFVAMLKLEVSDWEAIRVSNLTLNGRISAKTIIHILKHNT